jgi:hypothetical protein
VGRQRSGEGAVDLHGDHPANPWRQCGGQCAASGTDFEERVTGRGADRVDDLRDPGLLQEVLAEAPFCSEPCPSTIAQGTPSGVEG